MFLRSTARIRGPSEASCHFLSDAKKLLNSNLTKTGCGNTTGSGKLVKQTGHSSSIKKENWRDLLNEFILVSTVIKDVEETKDISIDENNLKQNEIDNAPGPAVIDTEYKLEDSNG